MELTKSLSIATCIRRCANSSPVVLRKRLPKFARATAQKCTVLPHAGVVAGDKPKESQTCRDAFACEKADVTLAPFSRIRGPPDLLPQLLNSKHAAQLLGLSVLSAAQLSWTPAVLAEPAIVVSTVAVEMDDTKFAATLAGIGIFVISFLAGYSTAPKTVSKKLDAQESKEPLEAAEALAEIAEVQKRCDAAVAEAQEKGEKQQSELAQARAQLEQAQKEIAQLHTSLDTAQLEVAAAVVPDTDSSKVLAHTQAGDDDAEGELTMEELQSELQGSKKLALDLILEKDTYKAQADTLKESLQHMMAEVEEATKEMAFLREAFAKTPKDDEIQTANTRLARLEADLKEANLKQGEVEALEAELMQVRNELLAAQSQLTMQKDALVDAQNKCAALPAAPRPSTEEIQIPSEFEIQDLVNAMAYLNYKNRGKELSTPEEQLADTDFALSFVEDGLAKGLEPADFYTEYLAVLTSLLESGDLQFLSDERARKILAKQAMSTLS
ncbi:hypothetical protein CYMTET_56773 [Cymbomonas tetramitiformis]|uniref:Uncharacterized protein n=1 Tax=Cymbomonas tetramitiformis TaxID=36881 RepID=A0AAE0ENF3_9CHLO|nr:hypothetical protein CYMTET_56773 [Cymbomonas tetramitiformis]